MTQGIWYLSWTKHDASQLLQLDHQLLKGTGECLDCGATAIPTMPRALLHMVNSPQQGVQ